MNVVEARAKTQKFAIKVRDYVTESVFNASKYQEVELSKRFGSYKKFQEATYDYAMEVIPMYQEKDLKFINTLVRKYSEAGSNTVDFLLEIMTVQPSPKEVTEKKIVAPKVKINEPAPAINFDLEDEEDMLSQKEVENANASQKDSVETEEEEEEEETDPNTAAPQIDFE